MECPYCGNEIEEYIEECSYCGAALEEADMAEESEEEEATISDADYEDY